VSCLIEGILEVQVNSDQSAALFHRLLLYPVSPLYHHLYSAVCSKPILGTFHYRILFQEFPKSACDYNIDQLIYGVQECYGSVVMKDGNILVLMNKDYFRHQQVQIASILSF